MTNLAKLQKIHLMLRKNNGCLLYRNVCQFHRISSHATSQLSNDNQTDTIKKFTWNRIHTRNMSKLLLKNEHKTLLKINKTNSFYTKPKDYTVTLEDIFSDQNKGRVQEHMQSIRPPRQFSWAKGKTVPKAAVLVTMCTIQGEPSFLFTLRSSELNNYKGQVSFAGGKADDTDLDVTHTALREAEEELGLDPGCVDLWGQMLPVPSKDYKMAVYPILANCGELDLQKLKHNESEVADIFSRSISSLCHPDNTGYTRFTTGKGYTLPVYLGGPYRIWGLTAIIVHMTLTILAPGLYNHSFKQ